MELTLLVVETGSKRKYSILQSLLEYDKSYGGQGCTFSKGDKGRALPYFTGLPTSNHKQ